jgi:PHD/YefM family antitoxin component YafN of YafNO toxin-antitoxin module
MLAAMERSHMTRRVSAAEVEKNFDRYQTSALVAPVTVTKRGRPSVVILAASEYARLRKLDRRALAISELSEQEMAAIRRARVPAKRRYRLADLK